MWGGAQDSTGCVCPACPSLLHFCWEETSFQGEQRCGLGTCVPGGSTGDYRMVLGMKRGREVGNQAHRFGVDLMEALFLVLTLRGTGLLGWGLALAQLV